MYYQSRSALGEKKTAFPALSSELLPKGYIFPHLAILKNPYKIVVPHVDLDHHQTLPVPSAMTTIPLKCHQNPLSFFQKCGKLRYVTVRSNPWERFLNSHWILITTEMHLLVPCAMTDIL